MADSKERAGKEDGAWFAPKHVGYGSGMPLNWQGWAMLSTHIAAIIGFSAWGAQKGLPDGTPAQLIAYIAGLTLIALFPFPLYAAKTRGGWKWRSGKG